VVTDYCTFSWLCDVFILEEFRGYGLGKWLISTIVEFPNIEKSNRFLLATSDAHELYSKHGGFEKVTMPEKLMVRIVANVK
jgi:GNAT superfamily N-acetyltransferase